MAILKENYSEVYTYTEPENKMEYRYRPIIYGENFNVKLSVGGFFLIDMLKEGTHDCYIEKKYVDC